MMKLTLIRSVRTWRLRSLGLVACLLIGCGGGDDFATAPVSGTVTMNGQPVTGGTITFVPLGEGEAEVTGKPASGAIQKDGSFTLSTYEEGDGAVIGKHRVMYAPPPPVATAVPEGGHGAPSPPSPYAGAFPVKPQVEVTSGENQFDIKISKSRS